MQKPINKFDVIVIGGGASGMMAAGRAGELGKRVLVLEKNSSLGKKLKITGGGRCNITNAEEDQQILLSKYGSAKDFLFSPFSQFGVKETFNFFEGLGLPLVIQEFKRVFPKTEKAIDVFKVLEKYMKRGNVEILAGSSVEGISGKGGMITGVRVNGKILSAESYILATGGMSHPETGSTGDGFSWLKKLGHEVKEPSPTIVPLAVADKWVKELAGNKLSSVRVTFYADKKKELAVKGDVLCTHFGLSGPVILNSAGKVADMFYEGTVTASIDLHPKEDLGSLDKRLTSIFDENKNFLIKNIFNKFGPAGTGRVILPLLGIPSELRVHSITKEQRKHIVHTMKALPVTITRLMGYDRAVVADGGVSLKQIDTRTMRSLLYKNLYITGDLINISRPSGGYSLQLCWTTGFVAASAASRTTEDSSNL
jgi:predicted Rossmann fold flavoprotein